MVVPFESLSLKKSIKNLQKHKDFIKQQIQQQDNKILIFFSQIHFGDGYQMVSTNFFIINIQ